VPVRPPVTIGTAATWHTVRRCADVGALRFIQTEDRAWANLLA